MRRLDEMNVMATAKKFAGKAKEAGEQAVERGRAMSPEQRKELLKRVGKKVAIGGAAAAGTVGAYKGVKALRNRSKQKNSEQNESRLDMRTRAALEEAIFEALVS